MGIPLRHVSLHGHDVTYRLADSDQSRPTLLLIHGLAGNSRTWKEVMPALADDFTVLAPGLLGHGESAKPMGDYSLGAFASGLRDLITVLDLESVTVVGQSLGGGIAMQLAYQHPELVDRLVLIGSAKTVSGFDMIKKIAVGADMVNAARTMLFAVGCIQALRCDTNRCPSGIATQDPHRNRAVDVELRQQHVANYHAATVRSFLDLVGAMGLDHPNQLGPEHLLRRQGDQRDESYRSLYAWLEPGQLLSGTPPQDWAANWAAASAARF